MMFYPADFVGIRPILGWQGLVPANAERLAKVSTQLITTKLLDLEELFRVFDPKSFTGGELDPVIDDIVDQIIAEVAEKRAGPMWEAMAEDMQQQIRGEIRKEVARILELIVGDFAGDIKKILDLEKVVVDAVVRDRRLLSMMFLEVGEAEFKFIEISAASTSASSSASSRWCVWMLLPRRLGPSRSSGFFVGYATNWIAIKLIFEPKRAEEDRPLRHPRPLPQAPAPGSLDPLQPASPLARVLNAENIVQDVVTDRRDRRAS